MGARKSPAAETSEARRERAGRICDRLTRVYPDTGPALHFRNAYELLVATILSAQCTDARVNEVTPAVFARYPDPGAMAAADPDELERLIHPTGFFRQKAKSLRLCCQALVERHGGRVPEPMAELTALPGVGRKTANVVRAGAMGRPGIIVDTHFKRLMERMALSDHQDPDKIEGDLCALLPESRWTAFSHAVITHGRRLCTARKPQCPACPVLADCPFGRAQIVPEPAHAVRRR